MTLILAALNGHSGIMFADGRISTDQKILEDDHAKIAQLELTKVRLLYSYTGLAYTIDHGFRTDDFLASTINDHLQRDMSAEHALTIICSRLTELFQSPSILALDPTLRRLTVLFVGFEEGQPFLGEVSNFEDFDGTGEKLRDEFRLRTMKPTALETKAMAYGNTAAVLQSDVETLGRLLHEGKSSEAVLSKAADILDKAAHDNRSRTTIGTNVLYGLIMADEKQASRCGFVCNTGGQSIPVIPIQKPQGIGVSKTKLELLGSTPPRQRPNERCYCGSKKKFKNCHGRNRMQ